MIENRNVPGPLIGDGSIGGVRPRDLTPLPLISATPPSAIADVVARARAAQSAWFELGFDERAALLDRACRAMLARYEESARLIEDEGGKIRPFALITEAIGPLDALKGWIKVARPYLRSRRLPINPLAMPGKRGRVDLIPRGVIGIIAPWNYPIGSYFKPLLPALLCGNAVVVKPSEYAPRSGAWFMSVLNEHLPAGVVNCVQGGPDVGKAIIDGGIDSLVFTGSVRSGKAVVKHAAEHMIPCSIELGGKDAAIVLADCDLERTVAGMIGGGLLNAGQDCGAIERVYVVDAIADRFVETLTRAVSRLRVPGPNDPPECAELSPICNAAQLRVVESHVKDAVERGAKVLCGGKATGHGLWFEPAVLDRCDHTMSVINDETFGPVIAVVRVKDEEEALRLANDSRYGLNASIWTRNIAHARTLANRLQVGSVFINNHGFTGAVTSAPWTGVKESGFGVANSEFSLHTFVRPRPVIVDGSKKPDIWWAPADALLTEIAERAAQVQLGRFLRALKLPFMIKERERRILARTRSDG